MVWNFLKTLPLNYVKDWNQFTKFTLEQLKPFSSHKKLEAEHIYWLNTHHNFIFHISDFAVELLLFV